MMPTRQIVIVVDTKFNLRMNKSTWHGNSLLSDSYSSNSVKVTQHTGTVRRPAASQHTKVLDRRAGTGLLHLAAHLDSFCSNFSLTVVLPSTLPLPLTHTDKVRLVGLPLPGLRCTDGVHPPYRLDVPHCTLHPVPSHRYALSSSHVPIPWLPTRFPRAAIFLVAAMHAIAVMWEQRWKSRPGLIWAGPPGGLELDDRTWW